MALKKSKQKHKSKKFKLTPTQQLFAATGLFALSAFLSSSVELTNFEISIFRFFHNLPEFLHPFFFFITQLGSIFMLGAVVVLYLYKKHYHIVIRLLMSGTLAYLLTGFAKDIWGRARPNDILLDVTSLDYIVRGPGFPSGHMALATAMSFTVAYYLPKNLRIIVPIWVIGVGMSRMYLGIHFPLDIIGGFAIGWASYAVFRHVRFYDLGRRKKTTS